MHAPLRMALVIALSVLPLRLASAGPFTGTEAKMVRQHAIAVEESYSFLRTPADVQRLVESGALVPVTDNGDFSMSGVSYAFARPEVRSFIEHFAALFHDSTGEQLVVTSLTRPEAQQPRNAHVLSVHPAGMAVDFRVPAGSSPRAWLDRTLLAMQGEGLIDVTREHTPPHYHIAVFAERWLPFAARQDSLAAAERARVAVQSVVPAHPMSTPPAPEPAGGSLPGFVLTMMALAGVTAPALRIRRKGATI
jgi:Family of unknown function (DUF5715)